MLLLEVVAWLGKQNNFSVRAIHIDHGTQKQQGAIERRLQTECDRLGIELLILRTELDAMAANFEATARGHRLKLLHLALKSDEVIAFGHHIDDSYEWSWLQSLRSGSVKPALGIPLINGRRVRPFMCLTRAQIKHLHTRLALWHFEDSSNNETRFARNHLRAIIRSEVAPRYPQYLRHYVTRSNDLAKSLGVSVFKSADYRIKHASGVRVMFTADPRGLEEQLVKLFHGLSKDQRSSVRREIDKLVEAFHRGRQGPHQLPGEVKAWLFAGCIMFTDSTGEKRLRELWQITSQITGGCSDSTTIVVAIEAAPKWLRRIALKSHPLVSASEQWVLIPWSRFVKIPKHKLSGLCLKHLNI